ncbi:MAG: 30S ribosomal protein S12 methylthiotransferase RimO [Oscillospiraceae bacterium]
MKVSMISLGCCKNQIDAEMMLSTIQNGGFELCGDVGDVVIINTCGFIQPAKEEAIENILEMAKLKEEDRVKAIIVTGCMAERYKEQILEEMPEVDAVVGIGSNDKICDAINQVLAGKTYKSFDKKECLSLNGERVLTTLPHYAYIKVAEGCDNCCSYCAIPSIRGRFRSRKIEDILKEAEFLAKNGVKELIVVAQDTTRYGEDLYGEYKLAELLKQLAKIDGIQWIRTLYCYPDKITDELIQVMETEPKVLKYLDIPIQHCNKEVLKAMNRKDVDLKALFAKLKDKNFTIRTTVITGFPGETNEQFEELCEFCQEIKFDRLGCFAFSPEEGTKAYTMENQIDEDIKQNRCDILMEIQNNILFAKNEEKIGKEIEVIVDGFDKYAECYIARSKDDAPEIDCNVFFTSENSHIMGDFVKVNIEEVMDYDLIGKEC